MVRVTIKGGVWRNTEDEVLKAAVMKYGKNQWSRIASLLHRKSAKQCKSRWFEWLDPGIKKTEWSREEDEKLLHMAKLMPTQWRTIAPIVGRTAAQCLERYEHLLDKAQKKAFEGGSGEPDDQQDDPRKLKPGEIDPNPETKPARPDPIDMDEDELEMLSEARARLANTQGKKAKRKARERQLEEARRLAALQKRRELKAAGIQLRKFSKKKREVEYNKEIPFEKKPAIGFYDPTDDKMDKNHIDFKRLRQEHMEKPKGDKNPPPGTHGHKKRKGEDDDKKGESASSILESQSLLELTRKRSKLVLPAPQISDLELEEVVKLGVASEQAHQQAHESEATQTAGTGQLLANYQLTPDLARLRTPAVPASQDTIMIESQNLLALQLTDTPLKGGANTPLVANGAAITTPLAQAGKQVVQTPNTMFTTPFRTPHGEVQATPTRTPSRQASNTTALVAVGGEGQEQTPAVPGTPSSSSLNLAANVRDKLAINPEDSLVSVADQEQMSVRDTVRLKKQTISSLKDGLSSLPKPKNDYEIVLPGDEDNENNNNNDNNAMEDQDENEDGDENRGEHVAIMDQAEYEERQRRLAEERRVDEMRHKSRSIQRDLPRPADMNHNILRPAEMGTGLTDYQRAEELIKEEMLVMLHHDAVTDPTLSQCGIPLGSAKAQKVKENKDKKPKALQYDKHARYGGYETYSLDEMRHARALCDAEVPAIKRAMNHGEISGEVFAQVWDECYAQVLYVPGSNRFTRASVTSRKDKIESCEKRLEINRYHMSVEAKRAGKLEQKLKIMLGGYQSRSQVLFKSLQDIYNQMESRQVELSTFKQIRGHELNAMPKRLESLRTETQRQAVREKELQKRFGELLRERNILLARFPK